MKVLNHHNPNQYYDMHDHLMAHKDGPLLQYDAPHYSPKLSEKSFFDQANQWVQDNFILSLAGTAAAVIIGQKYLMPDQPPVNPPQMDTADFIQSFNSKILMFIGTAGFISYLKKDSPETVKLKYELAKLRTTGK